MDGIDDLRRTTPSRRLRSTGLRLPALATVLVLVVAACGSSGTDDAASDSPTSPTTSADPSPTDGAEDADGADASDGQTTTVDSATTAAPEPIPADELELIAFPVPAGSRPHDVAPDDGDGGVWYTAQGSGELGWLDPATGDVREIPLGDGSRPHGVIVGEDGAAWVTDGGRNSIIRVDGTTDELTEWPLPADRPDANLNTAAFDGDGQLWFTGQNGIYGVLDPVTGAMEVFDAPEGRGPYGITTTPSGTVYYASLAGSYIGRIEPDQSATVIEPPTPEQGARRVWSDSTGSIWVSEWNAGQLSRYVPDSADGGGGGDRWTVWPLPGDQPQAYAVYVDDSDIVWVSDFGDNAVHRFDPVTEGFTTFDLPSQPGDVRQILGRPGEVWAAESAADQLVVIRQAS